MRLLLDTQIYIWYATTSPLLKGDLYRVINNPDNTIYLSQISLFEIAIKQKIGKLPTVPFPIPQVAQMASRFGFTLLPITTAHIAAYDRLPLLPEHRDPFDRLLLSTALAEDMPIVSADEHFPRYAPLVSVIES